MFMCTAIQLFHFIQTNSCFNIEPVKPTINVPKKGKVIPVSDKTPATLNVGDNITALTNSTVIIRCPVNGVPTPNLVWTHDGKEITSSQNHNIDESGTLSVSLLSQGDNGRYFCHVQNKFGNESKGTTVDVVGKLRAIK